MKILIKGQKYFLTKNIDKKEIDNILIKKKYIFRRLWRPKRQIIVAM